MKQLHDRTTHEPCRTSLPPLQRSSGPLSNLRWGPEGCGKWIPADFRMCVTEPHVVLPDDLHNLAIYAADGGFYSQKLEDAGLDLGNGCRQTAFFHHQEWKKVWAKEAEALGGSVMNIAPLKSELLLNPPPFKVTSAGISILTPTGAVVERA